MISRLSAIAAIFAVLASASLAGAASLHRAALLNHIEAQQLPVVQLETVVVTGKRTASTPR